jgi:hypothetical protein
MEHRVRGQRAADSGQPFQLGSKNFSILDCGFFT